MTVNSKPQISSHLKLLREQELIDKERRHQNYSTRQSSFGSLYVVKRPMENSSYIVSNLKSINNDTKLNTIKEQKAKPIKKIKHAKKQVFTAKVVEEIKLINDLMVKENTNPELLYN